MKNKLVYFDINQKGGAPEDLKNFLKYCKQYEDEAITSYKHLFKSLCESEITYTLFGGLIFKNLYLFVLLRFIIRRKVIFWNFSQLCGWNRTNKLFNSLPIISDGVLEENASLAPMVIKNSILKDIYIYFAKRIYRYAHGFIVASDWEADELKNFFNLKNIIIKKFDFGNSKPIDVISEKKSRVVFWGRVDYLNKGFDRLTQFVNNNETFLEEHRLLTYVVGPDYNQGKSRLSLEITELSLDHLIIVVPDNELTNYKQSFFTDSSISILLSRFEGHSRTCREASKAGMKQIISSETHMSEKQGCFNVDIPYEKKKLRQFIKNNQYLSICNDWTNITLLDDNWTEF